MIYGHNCLQFKNSNSNLIVNTIVPIIIHLWLKPVNGGAIASSAFLAKPLYITHENYLKYCYNRESYWKNKINIYG